jgi:hypothetical protein
MHSRVFEHTPDNFEPLLGPGRGSGRPANEPVQGGAVDTIPATVGSDDGAVEESFDALAYVRALSDADLRTLIEDEGGGWSDDANDIAGSLPLTGDYASMEPGVRRVAAYVDLGNPNASGWLEVRLDRDALALYARVERPHPKLDFERLYAEEE